MESDLVKLLLTKIDSANLPKPELEYQFHDHRKWKFDIAFPQYMLAIEVEGGIWTGGRHVSPKGYKADREKYNTAQLFGWTVLSYVDEHITTSYAINQIKAAFIILNGDLHDAN